MDHSVAPEGGAQNVKPPRAQTGAQDGTGSTPEADRVWRPASTRRDSTRGGAGAAAGSTPKKAHRPSAASKHRPAGKKPDSSRH